MLSDNVWHDVNHDCWHHWRTRIEMISTNSSVFVSAYSTCTAHYRQYNIDSRAKMFYFNLCKPCSLFNYSPNACGWYSLHFDITSSSLGYRGRYNVYYCNARYFSYLASARCWRTLAKWKSMFVVTCLLEIHLSLFYVNVSFH